MLREAGEEAFPGRFLGQRSIQHQRQRSASMKTYRYIKKNEKLWKTFKWAKYRNIFIFKSKTLSKNSLIFAVKTIGYCIIGCYKPNNTLLRACGGRISEFSMYVHVKERESTTLAVHSRGKTPRLLCTITGRLLRLVCKESCLATRIQGGFACVWSPSCWPELGVWWTQWPELRGSKDWLKEWMKKIDLRQGICSGL